MEPPERIQCKANDVEAKTNLDWRSAEKCKILVGATVSFATDRANWGVDFVELALLTGDVVDVVQEGDPAGQH